MDRIESFKLRRFTQISTGEKLTPRVETKPICGFTVNRENQFTYTFLFGEKCFKTSNIVRLLDPQQ